MSERGYKQKKNTKRVHEVNAYLRGTINERRQLETIYVLLFFSFHFFFFLLCLSSSVVDVMKMWFEHSSQVILRRNIFQNGNKQLWANCHFWVVEHQVKRERWYWLINGCLSSDFMGLLCPIIHRRKKKLNKMQKEQKLVSREDTVLEFVDLIPLSDRNVQVS